jgi:MFS transporter, DHA1 family, multidrug resistance protein
MLAVNALSCDILMPAFSAIQEHFGASITAVQAVVPIYLLAMACGQIIFGPASDRFGRRPVLLVGIIFYIAGSLVALAAGSINGLYAGRALQGFGASCLIVLGRAILRDTHSGPDLARAMAMAMAVITIGPLCAPLLGVGLVAAGGWRAVFGGLTVLGLGLLAAILWRYRESNLSPDPEALRPTVLQRAFGQVLRNPQSSVFMVILTLLISTVILLVSSAPRIFKSEFGLEGFDFALLFAVAALGLAAGQVVNTRLISRLGVLATTRLAAGLLLGCVAVTALLVQTGLMTQAVFIGLLALFNMTFLVLVANSVSLILEPHREIAGTASAVLGCLTQLGGSLLALVILPFLDGQIASWSLVQLVLVAGATLGVFSYQPLRPSVAATRDA